MSHCKRIEPARGWPQGYRHSMAGAKRRFHERKPNRKGAGHTWEEQLIRVVTGARALEKRMYAQAAQGKSVKELAQRHAMLVQQAKRLAEQIADAGRVLAYPELCKRMKQEKGLKV